MIIAFYTFSLFNNIIPFSDILSYFSQIIFHHVSCLLLFPHAYSKYMFLFLGLFVLNMSL